MDSNFHKYHFLNTGHNVNVMAVSRLGVIFTAFPPWYIRATHKVFSVVNRKALQYYTGSYFRTIKPFILNYTGEGFEDGELIQSLNTIIRSGWGSSLFEMRCHRGEKPSFLIIITIIRTSFFHLILSFCWWSEHLGSCLHMKLYWYEIPQS